MNTWTLDDWYVQVAANPKDWDLRLVFADWLEEQRINLLAFGQRYQARQQQHPMQAESLEGTPWVWVDRQWRRWHFHTKSLADLTKLEQARIPRRVFRKCRKFVKRWFVGARTCCKAYNTFQAAEIDYARAIHKLRPYLVE